MPANILLDTQMVLKYASGYRLCGFVVVLVLNKAIIERVTERERELVFNSYNSVSGDSP